MAGRPATGCIQSGSAPWRRTAPWAFPPRRAGPRSPPGPLGPLAPAGPVVRPTLLLVPLLAFDRRGHRLGYGAGYYDRTLAGLPDARTIGCAFAAQEVDAVPAGPADIPLQQIATERGLISMGT